MYKRKSGGIGIYVRENLTPFINVIENDCEYVLWIKLNKQITNLDDELFLGSVYIPPENSRFFNEDLLLDFENEITDKCCDTKYVFLIGDINGRTGTLRDYTITDRYYNDFFELDDESQSFINKSALLDTLSIPLERSSLDHKTNTSGLRFIEICRNNNLFIFNGRLSKDKNNGAFTFRDRSVIDYAVSTAECFKYIEDFDITLTDSIFSDGHNALCFRISFPELDIPKQKCNCTRNNKPKWRPESSHTFVNNIDKEHLNITYTTISDSPNSPEIIESVADEISAIFSNAASQSFPPTTRFCHPSCVFSSYIKPWFGLKCQKSRSNYHDARESFRKNPNSDNKLRLRNASKMYKRTMDFYIKKHKTEQHSKLRKLSEKNPKQYWKYLSSLKHKQTAHCNPSTEDFYDHFQKVNENTITDDRFANENLHTNTSNDFLNLPISSTEINKCIQKLSNNKASSCHDNILNEYIKATETLLMPLYCQLFNSVLNTGYLPKAWLEGIIVPIYKNKGDPKDATNYRPITILSCLGKLFTSVLNQRLSTFLETSNILEENQAGFRKGYSCSDHIFTLYSLIELMKKRKQKLFCAFIDFSQAFDKVWRAGLWHKLIQNSINGKFLTLIINMYNNIKSCISCNGNLSSSFVSEIGVRQGENLSPLLFSLFLNDMQSYLTEHGAVGVEFNDHIDIDYWLKLLVLLYADDTILIGNSQTDLQNNLNIFNNYCKMWHLHVNTTKTKVVIFGARHTQCYQFTLDQETLDITDCYHYLGVTLSSNGSFLKARKHVTEQANKALHLLFTRINNANLPTDLIIKLFDHTVVPILTYGSEIFGFENLEILEKVHNYFLRRLTKARKSTPIAFLHGELGRYPMSVIIKSRMISFWIRLITGKADKLSLQIYKHMLSDTNNNYKWINKIKDILFSVGRPDLWYNQFQITNLNTHKQIKQTLIDQYKQEWHNQLQISNKGRIYSNIKEIHGMEMYFTALESKEHLNIFKFRTANHLLPVETGRYDGTPFNDRKCPLCDSGEVGTETHYLLHCHYFRLERQELLDLNALNIRPHKSMNTYLSNDTPVQLMKKVSKFVGIIMRKFTR